jgi:hypothetical protein
MGMLLTVALKLLVKKKKKTPPPSPRGTTVLQTMATFFFYGDVKKKFLNFIPKTAISRPSSTDVSSGAPDFSDPNVAATEAKASVKR